MYFHYLAITSLWQRAWLFIWANFHKLGIHYFKHGRTWLSDNVEVNMGIYIDGNSNWQTINYRIFFNPVSKCMLAASRYNDLRILYMMTLASFYNCHDKNIKTFIGFYQNLECILLHTLQKVKITNILNFSSDKFKEYTLPPSLSLSLSLSLSFEL